jgi:hypothetical protein
MPNIPNTSLPMQPLLSVGDGSNASVWGGVADDEILYLTRSYPVLGPLIAYTFPGWSWAWPMSATQTVSLYGVITQLSAGTGTVSITQNGSNVTGLTSLSVTTSSSGLILPTNPTPVASLDRFSFVLSSPSGTGDIVIDYVFALTP